MTLRLAVLLASLLLLVSGLAFAGPLAFAPGAASASLPVMEPGAERPNAIATVAVADRPCVAGRPGKAAARSGR